jgi:5'-nucleotidase
MTGKVVLVTNDDGVDSAGLAVLARAVRRHPLFASDITIVAAPSKNMSGTSAAIGPGDINARFRKVRQEDGLIFYCVEGPPAVAVLAAAEGHFGAPLRFVASGINRGLNLGWGVLHSGTVGAALTAQNLGVPALAVSAEPTASAAELDATARLGVSVVDDLLTQAQEDCVLVANVNVASGTGHLPLANAELARSVGVTATASGPEVPDEIPIRANVMRTTDEGTDAALAPTRPTVTYLQGLWVTAIGTPVG